MKETNELITSVIETVAQGIESFADGVQLKDLIDFFDEAVEWGEAITGLAEAFPQEARDATPESINAMFDSKIKILVEAGLNEMLAGAIITNLKGIYYAFAAIAQSKQEIVRTQ